MNHPSVEDLSGFLYEELPANRHADIALHVRGCPDCRRQLDAWKAVRQELPHWHWPEAHAEPQSPHRVPPPWAILKWAVAASLLAAAGFLGARFAAPRSPAVDVERLRTALVEELRQELRTELDQFAADQTARHQAFREAVAKSLGRLEAQRLVDYATLRQDMETVAVLAQDELQTTRRDLVRLINFEP